MFEYGQSMNMQIEPNQTQHLLYLQAQYIFDRRL